MRAHRDAGWLPIGWFLNDFGKRMSAHTLRSDELQHVHEALFGYGELAQTISLRTTMNLLLASVGIEFDIAPNKTHAGIFGDGHCKENGEEFYFDFSDVNPGLSPAYFRQICGIPPFR